MPTVVRYGVRIIILKVKELRLDLVYIWPFDAWYILVHELRFQLILTMQNQENAFAEGLETIPLVLAAVKEQVINAATEAACMILRIDNVITASKTKDTSPLSSTEGHVEEENNDNHYDEVIYEQVKAQSIRLSNLIDMVESL